MWGAEGPQQVKPHTARGVQEPLRTTKRDEILQLLLHLWLLLLPLLSTHTYTHFHRQIYTYPDSEWWEFITTVEAKCLRGRKTSWVVLWTLRPSRQREENTALSESGMYILDCDFKSAVFTLQAETLLRWQTLSSKYRIASASSYGKI